MTDNISQNYLRDALIEKELENVEIENYLEFDYNGHYTWFECIYCGGPTLGHIQPKCPKIEYDRAEIERFKKHLRQKQIFQMKVKDRNDRDRKKVAEWSKPELENRTTEIRKQRVVPMWTGYRFEDWKVEIEKWDESLQNVSNEEKYRELRESLKKNSQIQDFFNNTLIEDRRK